MKASFNVLNQGWIPVISNNGKIQLLGIRQILAHAHELKEITDPSPLVEFSLYRFLGLFLMDALRPEDDDELEEISHSGNFDMKRIEKYISICESERVSFDLFDDASPFLQSLYDKAIDGDPKSVSVLDCTMPSGNNHTHYNHYKDDIIKPDKAIRLILTAYWFCTASAQGYPSNVYSVPPFFGVIKGNNLFETLTNLLLPIDSIPNFDDEPVLWRRVSRVQAKKEIGKISWLQGMLFPSRRIRLIPNNEGNVIGVYLSQGENFVNKDAWKDPYVTYITGKEKVYSFCPESQTPIWHNFYNIIDTSGKHASALLRSYRSLHNTQYVDLTLYGVETSQAKYLRIYRQDFQIPLKLSEQWIIKLLMKFVETNKQIRKKLEDSIKSIATIPKSAPCGALYFFDKESENTFQKLCKELNSGREDAQSMFNEYFAMDFKNALNAFDNLLLTLNLRAHALADASCKRSILYATIKKLMNKKELNNDEL